MTGFRGRASVTAGLFAAAALAAPAVSAQPKPEGRAPVLERLLDCRKLTEDAQRLACYDQAASAIDQAEAKGDVVVVDREQARTVRRQGFGFSMPSLAIFERGEKAEELDQVSLTVDRAWRDQNGRWNVALEGGQVWRQIDSGDFTVTPKPGVTASIRKASLGSYLMSIGGRAGVRVHRDK